MADKKNFRTVPPLENPDEVIHRRQLASAIQGLMDGKSNNIGEVTLSDGATSTVVSDRRVGPASVILLMPKTANAANLVRTTDVYVSSRTNRQFTVTHGNTANTDQDFEYAIVGT